MTHVLLPSGDYLNLASIARVRTLANGYINAAYLDGGDETFGPADAKVILEALDSIRLKLAYRKRN